MSVQAAATIFGSINGVDANAAARDSSSTSSFSSALDNARQSQAAAPKPDANSSPSPAATPVANKSSAPKPADTQAPASPQAGSKPASSKAKDSAAQPADAQAKGNATADAASTSPSTPTLNTAPGTPATTTVTPDTSAATASSASLAALLAQAQAGSKAGSAGDQTGSSTNSTANNTGATAADTANLTAPSGNTAASNGAPLAASLASKPLAATADFAALLGSGKDKPLTLATNTGTVQPQTNTDVSSLVADSTVAGATTVAGSTTQVDSAPPQRAWINEPVTGSQWGQAIGQQALLMVNNNMQSAELHLNPAHLGPMDVKLNMGDDGTSLSFTTHDSAVQEALQQSLPKLQQMFADSGLPTLNVQVHLGQNPQSGFSGGNGTQSGGQSSGNSKGQGTVVVAAPVTAAKAYRVSLGGVDVFA